MNHPTEVEHNDSALLYKPLKFQNNTIYLLFLLKLTYLTKSLNYYQFITKHDL